MPKEKNPYRRLLNLFDNGRRWHKGTLTDSGSEMHLKWIARLHRNAKFCFLGGMEALGIPLPLSYHHDVIRDEYGYFGVVAFNDDPMVTWEDVRIVLEKSALKWEEANS